MSGSMSRLRWLGALGLGVLLSLGGLAGPAGAKKTPPGDPPGNNGTVKIASDDSPEPNNEPHPEVEGCGFWVEFFGFDQGEEVKVTFTAHPPTGQGEELLTWQGVISDDPAGGGQDDDDVIGFNLSNELAGYEPHPQQGYHVKLQSDSLKAPGGPKQKVFWLKCTPQPAGTLELRKVTGGDDTAPAGPFTLVVRCNHAPVDTEVTLNAGETKSIPDVPDGTTCMVSEPDPRGAARVEFTEPNGNGQPDGQVKVTSGATTQVTVTNVYSRDTRSEQGETTEEPGGTSEGPSPQQPAPQPPAPQQPAPQEPAAQVAGATATAAAAPADATAPAALATLPRTGSATGLLALLGAWAVVTGGAVTAVARRRRQ